mmetsp:Transcript_97977/g.281860  ORF Transcript_97977/g.281860 Transcript_97977/m.281860 type:complete len:216 (+) Transcript_97977:1392-2039(+)
MGRLAEAAPGHLQRRGLVGGARGQIIHKSHLRLREGERLDEAGEEQDMVGPGIVLVARAGCLGPRAGHAQESVHANIGAGHRAVSVHAAAWQHSSNRGREERRLQRSVRVEGIEGALSRVREVHRQGEALPAGVPSLRAGEADPHEGALQAAHKEMGDRARVREAPEGPLERDRVGASRRGRRPEHLQDRVPRLQGARHRPQRVASQRRRLVRQA